MGVKGKIPIYIQTCNYLAEDQRLTSSNVRDSGVLVALSSKPGRYESPLGVWRPRVAAVGSAAPTRVNHIDVY